MRVCSPFSLKFPFSVVFPSYLTLATLRASAKDSWLVTFFVESLALFSVAFEAAEDIGEWFAILKVQGTGLA